MNVVNRGFPMVPVCTECLSFNALETAGEGYFFEGNVRGIIKEGHNAWGP